MASSLIALLDDIATILDDVSVMTKVAAKKTAGVLGDDLALNAQQVTGVQSNRELPVVWAVCKGSLLNKLILVPVALLISIFLPWLVTPLLMVGGAFLCFEGCEKLLHKWMHSFDEKTAHEKALREALLNTQIDMLALEKEKIKGAIRTDFILSAEILAITLGAVQHAPWMMQLSVLAAVAVLMTLGVYGLVAGIVKLDDAGIYLQARSGADSWVRIQRSVGSALLWVSPVLMKLLSVLGTAAMFLVGGGILVHGWPWLHHGVQAWVEPWTAADANGWFTMLAVVAPIVVDAVVGMVAGSLVLVVVTVGQKWRDGSKA